MNTCRNCPKLIPNRLCFCSACLPQLTQTERHLILTAQSMKDREQIAKNVVARLRGNTPAPRRESIPPSHDEAVEAFREARRILAPIIGRKNP